MPRRDYRHCQMPTDEIQVLSHPVRLCIMGLVTKNPHRSLRARSLHADLVAIEGFANLSLAQVQYHVNVMRHARVIVESA